MKISKQLSIIAAVICFALTASAQINSPYSKFGYGLLNDNASSAQRQMGSVGYAMNSGRQINVMNPASYAAADSLTFLFDMGLDLTFINQKEEDASANTNGGGLDYITLQVPIGKRMGASLGLVPYSSVGYSFGTEIENGINSRQGAGGINQLYLGFAGKIFKGFSLGFNASYLFGTTVNDVFVIADTQAGSTTLFERVLEVRDWRIQLGAQYNIDINPDNRVTLGLTWAPGKKLLGKAKVMQYDVNADEVPNPDDIPTYDLKHNASLAETWGAGISYTWNKKLFIEADYTYQPWSEAKGIDIQMFEPTRFADRYQIGLGAEFTPAQRGSYFKRITYRLGGFYNRDYIMVNDNNVREYGISCGFGLPALSAKTQINLGFEYRHRQATPNPLLQESYFSIRLGINFNELWFFQNKIR